MADACWNAVAVSTPERTSSMPERHGTDELPLDRRAVEVDLASQVEERPQAVETSPSSGSVGLLDHALERGELGQRRDRGDVELADGEGRAGVGVAMRKAADADRRAVTEAVGLSPLDHDRCIVPRTRRDRPNRVPTCADGESRSMACLAGACRMAVGRDRRRQRGPASGRFAQRRRAVHGRHRVLGRLGDRDAGPRGRLGAHADSGAGRASARRRRHARRRARQEPRRSSLAGLGASGRRRDPGGLRRGVRTVVRPGERLRRRGHAFRCGRRQR